MAKPSCYRPGIDVALYEDGGVGGAADHASEQVRKIGEEATVIEVVACFPCP